MNARKFEKFSVEIEFILFRPGALDHVDPFLGKFVTIVMVALRHTEHLEFALVPAGDNVQAEAALADMIGGDHFLGGDQGMEQGACTVPKIVIRCVAANRPQAQVTVSNVVPWKLLEPP